MVTGTRKTRKEGVPGGYNYDSYNKHLGICKALREAVLWSKVVTFREMWTHHLAAGGHLAKGKVVTDIFEGQVRTQIQCTKDGCGQLCSVSTSIGGSSHSIRFNKLAFEKLLVTHDPPPLCRTPLLPLMLPSTMARYIG